MNQFYISKNRSYLQGHGSRVFLHVDMVRELLKGSMCTLEQLPRISENPIVKVLKEFSVWGGPDKFYGDWVGYEVTANPEEGELAIFRIREAMFDNGLIELDQCPWS